MRYWSYRNIK